MMRRVISTAAVVFALVLNTGAQQAVTVVAEIPQSQRQGTYISSSYDVPVDAVGYFRIRADINASDYVDPQNSVKARLYWLDPATGTWKIKMGFPWTGGPHTDLNTGEVNPMPYMADALAELRGRSVRAELDVPIRMRVGVVVETSLVPFD